MVEIFLRLVVFLVLTFCAVWYCNKWFKEKQRTVVSRTRKKWKRLCKGESFDGRSIASQRLDSLRLFNLGRIISIPILVLLAAYIANFAFKLPSSEPEHWGQMGDFFGGMLNPILAFASFMALLYTVRIQSEELRLTREEFAKSVKAQKDIANAAKDDLKQQELLEAFRGLESILRVRNADTRPHLYKVHEHNLSLQVSLTNALAEERRLVQETAKAFNSNKPKEDSQLDWENAKVDVISLKHATQRYILTHSAANSAIRTAAMKYSIAADFSFQAYRELAKVSKELSSLEGLIEIYAQELVHDLLFSALCYSSSEIRDAVSLQDVCPKLSKAMGNLYLMYNLKKDPSVELD